MTKVLGLKNDALVYFVRCDLRPSGPTAHGRERGAGPRTRGARAALPPRPPAAGPQPWTRRRGAARERRASRGPRRRVRKHRALHASALRPGGGGGYLGGLHLQPAGERPGSGGPLSPPPRGAPAASFSRFLSPTLPPFLLPFPAPQSWSRDGAGGGLASPPGGGVPAAGAAPQPHAGSARRTKTNVYKINKWDRKLGKRRRLGLFLPFHDVRVSTGNPFA